MSGVKCVETEGSWAMLGEDGQVSRGVCEPPNRPESYRCDNVNYAVVGSVVGEGKLPFGAVSCGV